MIDFDSCVLYLDSRYFTEKWWWDISKQKNNGEVHGAKIKGIGFYFDGVDDYVDCGSDSSLDITDAITIGAWVKSNSTPSTVCDIVGKRNSSNEGGYIIYYKPNGILNIGIYDSGWHTTEESFTLPLNSWQHLVMLYDGSHLKLFVNGNEELTSDYTGDIDSIGTPVLVGKSGYEGGIFNGIIDEVRIYNRALSDEEIKILYNLTYRRV